MVFYFRLLQLFKFAFLYILIIINALAQPSKDWFFFVAPLFKTRWQSMLSAFEWHSWHFNCTLAGVKSISFIIALHLFWISRTKYVALVLKLIFCIKISVPMLLLCSCWTYVFHVSLQCQGVSGIIIVTMVTSFMLVYNSSSGNRSSSSASSLSPHRLDGPVPSMEKLERVPTSTLEGYTGVMDHKVNMHHLCVGRRSLSLYNVIDNDGSGSSFETF